MKSAMHPIFKALKLGHRFHFSLLAGEVEDVRLYWNWWWKQRDFTKMELPYTLADDDPLLKSTIHKDFVDTQSGADFFDNFLKRCLERKALPSGPAVPRNDFRAALIRNFLFLTPKQEHPEAIIVGGGYGSGKTTVMDFMRVAGRFPFTSAAVLGVDNFKLFFPEFDQIRMVADGRASDTVQDESKMLARGLFARLVSERRTFAWDASMSSGDEARERLQVLKDAGYRIKFIAIFTPVDTAVKLAMLRAMKTRRFIQPGKLEESHKSFLSNFWSYTDFFQEIEVFYNNPANFDEIVPPVLIAELAEPNNSLVIYNAKLFHSFVPKPGG